MIEVVCVEPYSLILQAPMADEFWSACEAVIPEILLDHRKKWRALLAHVLAEGAWSRRSTSRSTASTPTCRRSPYRQRVRVLVEQFAS